MIKKTISLLIINIVDSDHSQEMMPHLKNSSGTTVRMTENTAKAAAHPFPKNVSFILLISKGLFYKRVVAYPITPDIFNPKGLRLVCISAHIPR